MSSWRPHVWVRFNEFGHVIDCTDQPPDDPLLGWVNYQQFNLEQEVLSERLDNFNDTIQSLLSIDNLKSCRNLSELRFIVKNIGVALHNLPERYCWGGDQGYLESRKAPMILTQESSRHLLTQYLDKCSACPDIASVFDNTGLNALVIYRFKQSWLGKCGAFASKLKLDKSPFFALWLRRQKL